MTTRQTLVSSPRIGVAALARLTFNGFDVRKLWHEMMESVTDDAEGAGIGMDLSLLSQLLGDKKTGLAIQDEVLAYQRLYHVPCTAPRPGLRILALAAPVDIGGNVPIEFLLQGSDVALQTLYVVPGKDLPDPLPEHDIAMVIAPNTDDARRTRAILEPLAPFWPRPLLNLPRAIEALNRDKLWERLQGVPGLAMPKTFRVARADLERIGKEPALLTQFAPDGSFPMIVRPIDSNAGVGLDKLETPSAIADYLAARPESEFFLSRFVDYSSADGLFRKYRIVAVDGKPFAVHMAIADQWKVWYLNADMTTDAQKRAEEAEFMMAFDDGFGARHAETLAQLFTRLDLDYVSIDCAETKAGELLLFEADSSSIVHDMDPPQIFPYKGPQMRKIFEAFVDMLYRRAERERARAA
jgi:hypothetical protein